MAELIPRHILNVKPYQPGKPLEEIRREYGLKKVAKLASNENTLGPSPKALLAMQESLQEIHWYPDPNSLKLRETLAAKLGVETSWIHLGNGTEEILTHIVKAFLPKGSHAVRASMTFPIYGILAGLGQIEETIVPMVELKHDLPAMAQAVHENTRVVWLCNPNNPTGTWFTRQELQDFFKALRHEPLVVLDEAYFEYAYDLCDYPDSLSFLKEYPNLIITRTFSKAYGLSGVRIGYSIQRPELQDILNRVRLPFHINHVAQVGALAALEDGKWLEHVRSTALQGRDELKPALEKLGMKVYPSLANFLLFTGGLQAQEIYSGLLHKGVAVRPIPLEPNGAVRVTIGTPEENATFLNELTALTRNRTRIAGP